MTRDHGYFNKREMQIDYIDPIVCPKCGDKFVPTIKSPDVCIFCKFNKLGHTTILFDDKIEEI